MAQERQEMNEEIAVLPFVLSVQNRQCQVTLTGDLTAATIPDLQPALRSVLDQGASELVFDLAHAVMLDSSGIGILIASSNTMARRGGKVCVINVSPDILRLLQMMRLVDRLHVSACPEQENRRG
jgi:anti-anti-sigma factor